MENEKIQLSYKNTINYTAEELNVIGATTNTTLRTVTTHNDANCKYVRKFGTPYEIKQVTDIEDPVDTDLTITVKALDGTTLGSRVGGGAFSAGSTLSTAQACYIEATTGAGGTGTLLADIDIDTDVDAGGKNFILTGETIAVSTTITFYLSATGSTYYDSNYMYGGGRHTPDGTEALPYFTITTALAALGGAFTIVTVLDSCTYDEELTISGAYTLQAALGETPTITSGIGARITREVSHDGNNSDTAYVGKSGSDTTGTGTYQLPYATHQHAFDNLGARTYINTIDSETYIENIALSAACTMEPIYGKLPILSALTIGNNALTITGTPININGYKISDSNYGIISQNLSTINNCSCYNNIYGIGWTGTATGYTNNKCLCYGNINGIYITSSRGGTFGYTADKCICYDNSTYGLYLGNTATVISASLSNIICYNNGTGLYYTVSTANSTFNNCILYKNNYGFHHNVGSYFDTIIKLISYNNITFDLIKSNATPTITYSCYGTNSGFTIGAGCFTTEPQFCFTTNPYKLGLSSNSPCLKVDGSENDIGVILRTILISSNDVVINGFNINGQSQYNNAIGKTGATDYTGLQVKWCSIYNYQGIAIDDYSGADTTTTISNCKIYYNGNGIKFTRGGNTVEECLIYSNSVYGIHCDYTVNTFNHLILYGNQYGIYFESNSSGISIKNSIFNGNSLYGIYSEVSVSISYCCITDAVNSYIDITDTTNFTNNPLFINTNENEEDFNIKTKAGGYLMDSICFETADDGYDIGAYKVNNYISANDWKYFIFDYNPKDIDFAKKLKGKLDFENALGSTNTFAQDEKRLITLTWTSQQVSTANQRKIIEYLAGLVQTRKNGLIENETKIRVHFLKSQKLESGTSGVISESQKTITDTSKAWIENEFKGFSVNTIFESGDNTMNINKDTKICTVSGKSWTVNAWTGYWLSLYISNYQYYFYILSNTADTLTISDTYNYISETQTGIDWKIVKHFKIESNTEDILYLNDDDAELDDTITNYEIDFIICRNATAEIHHKQARFYYQQETWKTGQKLILEEE